MWLELGDHNNYYNTPKKMEKIQLVIQIVSLSFILFALLFVFSLSKLALSLLLRLLLSKVYLLINVSTLPVNLNLYIYIFKPVIFALLTKGYVL